MALFIKNRYTQSTIPFVKYNNEDNEGQQIQTSAEIWYPNSLKRENPVKDTIPKVKYNCDYGGLSTVGTLSKLVLGAKLPDWRKS